MSININDYMEKYSFSNKAKIKVDGELITIVTDKKDNMVYGEIKKDKIDDPEEFEESILGSKDKFEKVFYKGKILSDTKYLYEIYI